MTSLHVQLYSSFSPMSFFVISMGFSMCWPGIGVPEIGVGTDLNFGVLLTGIGLRIGFVPLGAGGGMDGDPGLVADGGVG